MYSILTRELGVIRATALGARKIESKLRGALEPYILSSISLVRGREHWRATSAESLKSISPSPLVARPLLLIEKLIQGESPHPELFDMVEEAIGSNTSLDEQFEISFVSRILFHLGYLKENDLTLEKSALIKAINDGITASHL